LVIFSVEYSPTEKSGIEEAGVGSRVRDVFSKAIVKPKEIVVNDFKENLSRFLQNMDDILTTSKRKYGDYIMDSIEINAEVSAEGKIGLMGSEVGVSGTHGIKFIFKRPDKNSNTR